MRNFCSLSKVVVGKWIESNSSNGMAHNGWKCAIMSAVSLMVRVDCSTYHTIWFAGYLTLKLHVSLQLLTTVDEQSEKATRQK